MAAESPRDPGEDKVESLIDELIHDIFSEPGTAAESQVRGVATTAALFETALGPIRAGTRTSAIERLVLSEVFASELADALAPALAEQLVPRLMKALEELSEQGKAGRKPASAARSGGEGKKPGAK